METKYELNCGSHTFIFSLEQRRYLKIEEENPDGFPFIYCRVYRTDNKGFFWEWEGPLLPSPRIEFQLVYADQVNIKGFICLFHSYETGDNFVFIDTKFGLGYEEHFEGNILQIDYGPIPDPDIPIPPVPVPKPAPQVPDEYITPSGFRDLFPYLYTQYWPNLQPSDEIYLVNIPATFSTSPFYIQLQNLAKGPDARQNMETEALKYINGQGSYAGCYIQSVHSLLYPLNIFPEVYNEIYYQELAEEEVINYITGKKMEGEDELLVPTTYPEQIQRIWENIIAMNIIEGYQPFKKDQLTKILVVDHIINYLGSPPASLSSSWMNQLIHASLVLPTTIFPLPPYNVAPLPPAMFTGTIVPYAIGDLQMVKHQPSGYEPGELAKIENVLAGEIKKTASRKKEMIQDSSMHHLSKNLAKQDEDYGDMLEKQVFKTLVESTTNAYDYGDLNISYGPPTTGIYKGTVTQTKDANILNQNPVEFAKKVLSRTVAKLDEKISERREHLVQNETEETIIHTIDNRHGNQNIRGLYYWLNKIYNMKLVNYGHRFLLEFLLKKPTILGKDEIYAPFLFPPVPLDLLDPPIHSYQDINASNYIELGQKYGIYNLPFPPVTNKIVTGKISGENYRLSTELEVPTGYIPKLLKASCNFTQTSPPITGTLIAGEAQKTVTSAADPFEITDPLPLLTQQPLQVGSEKLVVPVLLDIPMPTQSFTIPVTSSPPPSPPASPLTLPQVPAAYISLSLICICSETLTNEWHQDIYLKLQQGYQDCLKKYKSDMFHQTRSNPQVIDQWIRKMVTHSCKQVLWEQHEMLNGTPPPLSPPEDVVNQPAYNQFYNEAFEWDKMIFETEHHAPLAEGENLTEHLDESRFSGKLERFLSSGQIRVILPVTQLYNYRVMYYLESGLMAYGEDHLTPIFTKDEALAIQLKKVFDLAPRFEVREMEQWKLTVPTEMQWLADSNQLSATDLHVRS